MKRHLSRSMIRLGVLRGVARAPLPATRQRPGMPLRVLVIRPDDLGDLVLASPALARLRAGLPTAHLTLAIGPWAAAAVPFLPHLDDVITIPFTGVSRTTGRSRLGPYRLLVQQARVMRHSGYTAALVLRPDHWWGALLAWAAGIPRRVGYAVPEVAPFLTDSLPLVHGVHAARQSLLLVDQVLGTQGANDPASAPLVFQPTSEHHAAARHALAGIIGAGPLVAIQPGAGNPIKQWRTERWIAVARTIVARGGRLVLTGGPREAELTAPIAAAVGGPVLDLAGRTDLGTLAAVFAQCALVLGVDSGALHIATAVVPRTLRLYGPSDSVVYGPWGVAERHRSLWAGLACPLCHRLDRAIGCVPDCMGALSVDQVLTVAVDLLPELGPAGATAR